MGKQEILNFLNEQRNIFNNDNFHSVPEIAKDLDVGPNHVYSKCVDLRERDEIEYKCIKNHGCKSLYRGLRIEQ